jgi:hypothetical protein
MELNENIESNLLDSEVYRHLFSNENSQTATKEFSGLGYSDEIVNKYFSRLEKRFEKGEIGEETYYELYDLLTNPDNFSKTNLLEDSMKKEFRGLRKIGDIMEYESNEDSWRGIDRLGLEYFREKQQGYGNSVENRSQKQIKIINEIVERTLPYITKIVDKFLEKRRAYAPRKKEFFEEDSEEKVKVKESYFNSDEIFFGDKEEFREDLVNDVAKKVIQQMRLYLPEASSMSGFIRIVANSGIISSLPKIPFIKIPENNFNNFCRIISDNSKKEAINELEDLILGGPRWHAESIHPLSPALVYESLKGNLISLNELEEEEIVEETRSSPYFNVAENELKKFLLELLNKK